MQRRILVCLLTAMPFVTPSTASAEQSHSSAAPVICPKVETGQSYTCDIVVKAVDMESDGEPASKQYYIASNQGLCYVGPEAAKDDSMAPVSLFLMSWRVQQPITIEAYHWGDSQSCDLIRYVGPKCGTQGDDRRCPILAAHKIDTVRDKVLMKPFKFQEGAVTCLPKSPQGYQWCQGLIERLETTSNYVKVTLEKQHQCYVADRHLQHPIYDELDAKIGIAAAAWQAGAPIWILGRANLTQCQDFLQLEIINPPSQ